MQSMLEVPDDAIAAPHAKFREDRKEQSVQRNNRAVVHVVANFPADAAGRFEGAVTFPNHLALLFDVPVKVYAPFVFFAQVVRWRRDDELKR